MKEDESVAARGSTTSGDAEREDTTPQLPTTAHWLARPCPYPSPRHSPPPPPSLSTSLHLPQVYLCCFNLLLFIHFSLLALMYDTIIPEVKIMYIKVSHTVWLTCEADNYIMKVIPWKISDK